jgi:hypothetical protein
LLTISVLPTISGSAFIRVFQKSWLKTTRGSPIGLSSMAASKPAPRASLTPSVWK